MNIFKFRVLIDTTDDIFRDIEIRPDQTFEEFYNCIVEAFEFGGGVMSSYYISNDNWDKGQEITLLDMSEKNDSPFVMNKCLMNDYVTEENQKIILVYDFMRMWCFYIELVDEFNAAKGHTYPRVGMKFGDAPAEESKELSELSFGGFDDTQTGDLEFDENADLDDDDDVEGSGNEVDDMFDELSH